MKQWSKAKQKRILENSYFKNGVEVVFLPLHNKGYVITLDGERWLFINSRLREKRRAELLNWGFACQSELEFAR